MNRLFISSFSLILTALCLLTFTGSASQLKRDTLPEFYNKYPQEALHHAEKFYQQGIKEQNGVLLIKSLILKTTFSIHIDKDTWPYKIKELEAFIEKEKDVAVKSILNSYLAELYYLFYDQNRYQINSRTPMSEQIPTDMNEWSSNIFREQLFNRLLSSISQSTYLQSIKTSDYDMILDKGSDTELLCPTLYDFLMHRTIRIMAVIRFPSNSKPCPAINHPLQQMEVFLTEEINPIAFDVVSNILKMYQQWLSFRKEINNPLALLITDLERLEYTWVISKEENKDSCYLAVLQAMKKRIAPSPIVVEIIRKEAELFVQEANRIALKNREALKQKALNICEEGIRQYPTYNRINLLNNIIQEIKEPVTRVQFEKRIYPGACVKLKISSCNVSNLTVQIDKMKTDYMDFCKNNDVKKKSHLSKVFQQVYSLPQSLTEKDTVIEIPVKDAGLYGIKLNASGAKDSITDFFICDPFSVVAHQFQDHAMTFIVRDRMSGKPMRNAKITLYDSYYDVIKAKVVGSLTTDRYGFAETKQKCGGYQISNADVPAGVLFEINQNDSRQETLENKTTIITDRKIYRPGQTVFFKGYSWFASTDTLYTENHQTLEVCFRDANNNEIAKQHVTTNEFGTFTGSFIIPEQSMNGTFRIDLEDERHFITVAEYKRPVFDIQLSTKQKKYRNGEQIFVKGKASSFSGVNLQGDSVKYSVSQRSMYGYSADNRVVSEGVTQTDHEGLFEIEFKTSASENSNSYRNNYLYEVTATITDSKGETQKSTISIPVLCGKYTLYTKVPLQVNKNKKTAFYIYTDENMEEAICHPEYSISRLVTPDSIVTGLMLCDTIIEKTILSGTLSFTEQDSIFPSLQKERSGAYLFTVKDGDMVSKKVFYLYSVTDKRPPIPTYDWFVEEKTECKPGENAEILFGTSAKSAYLVYEIYAKENLIKREIIKLSDQILHLKIPYLSSYGNGITVILSCIREQNNMQHIIEISKQREARYLSLHARVFRDKLLAGQQERWEFCVENAKGKNVPTEVLALMYDASLDKIENYMPEFTPAFSPIYHTYGWDLNRFMNNDAYCYIRNFDKKHFSYPYFRFDQLKTYLSYVRHSELEKVMLMENMTQGMGIGERYFQYMLCESTVGSSREPRAMFNRITSAKMDGAALPVIQLRKNFSETAFFYPHLRSDSTGKVVVKFTAPESTTKWKFIAIAHTPDMETGSITRYVTTSKELMIAPNLPRFFRCGDQTVVKATVSNLSDSLQKGESFMELFVPATGEVIIRKAVPFEVAAGKSVHVSFDFTVPADITIAGCRMVAAGKNFSDGEQKLVPVLPDKTMVTATQPFFSAVKGCHSYTLPRLPATRQDFRLTLEVTANPIWYVVQALPRLTEPRHENVTEISAAYYVNTIAAVIARANPKITNAIQTWAVQKDEPTLKSKLELNSELKSILLNASPWAVQGVSETERMQSLYQLFDSNRLEYLQQQAMDKLAKMQTSTGGWSWFEGMPASRFMTENVLTILARANTTGQKEYSAKEKEMQIRALRYLDKDIQKDSTLTSINSEQLLYLYVRSMYRDIPLGDALPVHKYFMSKIEKQWSRFSFYEKAIAATTLFRYGRMTEVKNILKSLRQYAVTTPEMGMYWPENRNQYYPNDAVQVHTAIMEAFLTVEGNSQDIRNMKQWLLRQKQTQQWGSVPATVDAIYVLLLSGNDELAQQEKLTIQLGNKVIAAAGDAFLPGYVKEAIPAAEIKPEMSTVKITKVTDSPTWGGLYLQYSEHLDRIKKTEGDLKVGKELFVEKTGEQGRVLSPLSNNTLHTGDKIVVRLTLSLNRDMQFLHLKDLRAACLEPVNQLSGNQWKFGTVYYQEVKDACTNLFFNALSRGTYVVEYPMWVNQTGVYQDGIATLQCVYAPEFSANSAATKIVVK